MKQFPLLGKDLMTRHAPDPHAIYPIEGVTRTCFLKNIITKPQIIIGDYTYYDDPEDIYNFEKNVLYLYETITEKIIIGKFCQIASGIRFLTPGGNHAMQGVSTYPFKVFGGAWENTPFHITSKGDTVVGHDVWFGNSVTVMPGIKIGSGSIIATNAVVTKDVEPYTIVGGNPAKPIRKRFDEDTIELLLKICWWDWPIEKITQNLESIVNGDIRELKRVMD